MNIKLPDRIDALGTNFCAKLAIYMFAKNKKINILHDTNIRYKNSIFTQFFIENTKELTNETNVKTYDETKTEGNIRYIQGSTVISLKEDLISHFKNNYKKEFVNTIKNLAQKKYTLPWNNNKNIICIHLRLYDGGGRDEKHNILCDAANNPDYDGRFSATYIKILLENNLIHSYDTKKMIKWCWDKGFQQPPNVTDKLCDRQASIDINKLNNIILDLKSKYPKKEIHVVTKLSSNPKHQKYVNLCNKYNIPIHGGKDADYDLWLLMNSEILVLSKSTYSFVSGLLHLGSKVIYPLWGVFASSGLHTKFDKTNWENYV
tara:strand:+ start:161 stop:1114 length:954 start_codon:yes stop_codon:yes gene_type:complete